MAQPCQQYVRPSALPYPGAYGHVGLFPEAVSPVPGRQGFTRAPCDAVLASRKPSPSEGASSGVPFFDHVVVILALGSYPQCCGWFFNESEEIPSKKSVWVFSFLRKRQ